MSLQQTWLITLSEKEFVQLYIVFTVMMNLTELQIPFRETHHVSGRAVALAEARQCQINELTFADFKSLHKEFTEDIYDVFNFEASVERRQAIGGTSKNMVERQISVLRSELQK